MNINKQTEAKLFKLIGRNIKYYRQIRKLKNNELTQEKLAELADVSTALIGNLESNKIDQGIGVFNLWKISNVLNIPINCFFTDPENKEVEKDLEL